MMSCTIISYTLSHSIISHVLLLVMLSYRYIGEIISDALADHRECDTYLFDLDNQVGCFSQSCLGLYDCGIECY